MKENVIDRHIEDNEEIYEIIQSEESFSNMECVSDIANKVEFLNLQNDDLKGKSLFMRGLEREVQRVSSHDFKISKIPHPESLGSALTHPYLTLDYCEAQLEFVTPVYTDIDALLLDLYKIHTWACKRFPEDELLWPGSMPPRADKEEDVPMAQFGYSNEGLYKHLYRQGLAVRYGRKMQSISGIHLNVSLTDNFWNALRKLEGLDTPLNETEMQCYRTDKYLSAIRNVQYDSWLELYLHGCSPAVDSSFPAKGLEPLEEDPERTMKSPFATCLRMSDLGYTSDIQSSLDISYNSFSEFLSCLSKAITTPHECYLDKIYSKTGRRQQINGNYLQIENEHYSCLRPKRVVEKGERALEALHKRGIQYLEFRFIDINPFISIGLDSAHIRFFDIWLIHALISPSKFMSEFERSQIVERLNMVAKDGRVPNLTLPYGDHKIPLKQRALDLLTQMQPIAIWLDNLNDTSAYKEVLMREREKVHNPDLTPSYRVMKCVHEARGFCQFAASLAISQTCKFREDVLSQQDMEMYDLWASTSIEDQKNMEMKNMETKNMVMKNMETKNMDIVREMESKNRDMKNMDICREMESKNRDMKNMDICREMDLKYRSGYDTCLEDENPFTMGTAFDKWLGTKNSNLLNYLYSADV